MESIYVWVPVAVADDVEMNGIDPCPMQQCGSRLRLAVPILGLCNLLRLLAQVESINTYVVSPVSLTLVTVSTIWLSLTSRHTSRQFWYSR
ncbi:hypothetical protein IG631_16022 [Alternaria alternata]|nr:hypothetical protein IG631_16022 [Alternaria alternata]